MPTVVCDAPRVPEARDGPMPRRGPDQIRLSIVVSVAAYSDPGSHEREPGLLGSRSATEEHVETVMAAFRAGRIPTDRLKAPYMPSVDPPTAFARSLDPRERVVRTLIDV